MLQTGKAQLTLNAYNKSVHIQAVIGVVSISVIHQSVLQAVRHDAAV